MQESGTTAGLRGIDSVDGTVAWASGTGGTVLKTIDGGAHWTKCPIPDAATDGATLDFRGVQAWDATTAIVMSSGKGKLSRLYKTKDGCKTWKLNFKNPRKMGSGMRSTLIEANGGGCLVTQSRVCSHYSQAMIKARRGYGRSTRAFEFRLVCRVHLQLATRR